jgi:hypothetical protein
MADQNVPPLRRGCADTLAPMSAGYSGTPLVRKLGFRPGMRVHVVAAPEGFAALTGELPDGVRVLRRLAGDLDLAVVFVTERSELERRLAALHPRLRPAGMIWVAWPKRASKVPTDVTEDVVRDLALPRGLVDVKVCAIDEVWSGLKLVVRRELRQRPAGSQTTDPDTMACRGRPSRR